MPKLKNSNATFRKIFKYCVIERSWYLRLWQKIPVHPSSQIHCKGYSQYPFLQPGNVTHLSQSSPYLSIENQLTWKLKQKEWLTSQPHIHIGLAQYNFHFGMLYHQFRKLEFCTNLTHQTNQANIEYVHFYRKCRWCQLPWDVLQGTPLCTSSPRV